MASPNPVPEKQNPERSRARRNGWNRLVRASGLMPGPVSRTENSARHSVRGSHETVTLPRSVNFNALVVRLSSARDNAAG